MGKTTAARCFVELIGGHHLSLGDEVPDDVEVTSPFRDDDVWQQPRDRLLIGLLGYTARLAPTVRVIIERALATDANVVIDGEGIEPRLVAECGDVRSVFVIERTESSNSGVRDRPRE